MRDHNFEKFCEELRAVVAPWTRIGTAPLPRDAGNAPHPDVSADGPRSPMGRPPASVWHSPDHRELVLHTPKGALRLDGSGKTRIHAADHEMAAHLASRGLHECRADGCTKDDTLKAIKAVLGGGRIRSDVVTAARKVDPTGALANQLGVLS
jgi:hypothetical protein